MKPTLMFRLVIVTASALVIAPLCSSQANLAGDWTGTLEADGNTMHVAWHLAVAPDGALTSTLDNIDQNIYGIKVKSTTIKGSDIALSVDDDIQVNGQESHVRGSFAGTVAAGGKEATGTWTQDEPAQPPVAVHFVHSQQAAPAASGTSASTSEPSVVGDWAGTLEAGGGQLRLVLHITAAKDGTLTATLDSIDQGANGIPVKTATFKDGKLSLDVAAVNGTYEGTVNKDASEIAGNWTQGQTLALNFKRTQPQTAAAPKPAAPTDIDGTWTGKLETGSSTLTINLKIANMDSGLTAQIQSPDQAPNWACKFHCAGRRQAHGRLQSLWRDV
ncbi:MAG TPA: hypothetical protein VGI45_21555 [Terracidiphilus sp.]|jgi:hypothetical protein